MRLSTPVLTNAAANIRLPMMNQQASSQYKAGHVRCARPTAGADQQHADAHGRPWAGECTRSRNSPTTNRVMAMATWSGPGALGRRFSGSFSCRSSNLKPLPPGVPGPWLSARDRRRSVIWVSTNALASSRFLPSAAILFRCSHRAFTFRKFFLAMAPMFMLASMMAATQVLPLGGVGG